MNPETELAEYDYKVGQEQIAATPVHPRDSAKLLVYDRSTGNETEDTFLHLDQYLKPGTLLILNDTKVVPARLPSFLPTGGKVELLWLAAGRTRNTFEALSPRTLDIGATLTFDSLTLTVLDKRDSIYTFRHSGTPTRFHDAMMHHGTTPIPPYLKHTSMKERELRKEYQTIFAKREGSVAAPTASLHFTKRLFAKLKKKGIRIAYVTLHVNMGTFAPLTAEHLKSGSLHSEWYEIPPATQRAIAQAKKAGNPVIPVGTTALRTLESAALTRKQRGTTTLFIRPGYAFKVADGLITNFHVPRSSLLMLVAALVGRTKILQLYRRAARHGFRFYSFGDGMLLL
jgi:S-adenosylmethionine:tRNA ribosyltransferase-isomerase